MLNEKQVQEIVAKLSQTIKGAAGKSKKGENPVYKGDWGMLYAKAYTHAQEIEVHACGKFPDSLIGANFPNETDIERDYRKRSFQPTTKPYWKKAMKTINRIWAEQNFTIDWNDDNAKEYFTKEFPLYENVLAFFKTIVTSQKIAEPNGLMVLDFDLPVRENENGELEIDDTKELEPYATIYESEDVVMYEENDYAVILSSELSVVEYASRMEKSGLVFYIYDDTNIWRIAQIGKKVDWQFSIQLYYAHDLGYMPAWKLKGTPEEVINDTVYYESYFAPALPYLNEAVIVHSTNKSVRNKVSYPTRAYYEQKCNAAGCSGGRIYDDKDGKEHNCSSCNGTGRVKFSPFSDYVHEAPTATNNTGAQDVSFPGFTYVSPDGTIIKDNEDVIDKYMERSFLFLNIDAVPDGMKAGLNDPTATKSKIDHDEQYISMLDISNECFHLLQNFLNSAYAVRYGKDSPITVKPPTNFDLISTDELSARLGEAKKAGLSDFALSEMTIQLMQQEFPEVVARKAEIAQYSDVLFVKETTDIQQLLAVNAIERWQLVLHTNFEQFINELVEADAAILQSDLKVINEKLIAMATKRADALDAKKQNADKLVNDLAIGA